MTCHDIFGNFIIVVLLATVRHFNHVHEEHSYTMKKNKHVLFFFMYILSKTVNSLFNQISEYCD